MWETSDFARGGLIRGVSSPTVLEMIARLVLISSLAAGCAASANEPLPGRASAEWIASSSSVRAGQPFHTAIRIRHDDGWHSYWLNPGQAGLPTSVEWKLPEGWKHGGLHFPVPTRFVSGGLAGFGYKGELLLPVTLVPPEDFTGKARLELTVSWLACGEEGCVPGDADLALEVSAGDAAPGPDAAAIMAAIDRVPRPAGESLRLTVEEVEKSVILRIHMGKPAPLDPSSSEIFPLTPEVIDPKAEIRFTEIDGVWTATVPKGEFAPSPVGELSLVIAGRDGEAPLEAAWKAP